MKALLTGILIFIFCSLWGQELDFKKDFETISKAINNSDAKAIGDFAPAGEFGPVDYISPNTKTERILKEEFRKRLDKLFQDYPVDNFTLLDAQQTEMNLPLAVGKYLTKDKKKYFILMMFAIFDDKYGLLTFHVVDKLPSSMKRLDR
jgi:hypothetical protein